MSGAPDVSAIYCVNMIHSIKPYFCSAAVLALPFAAFAQNAQVQTEPKDDSVDGVLDSVEVTAYRFGDDTLSVPVNAEVFDRAEIAESASTTVPEFLSKKANVRFMSYSGGYSDGNLSMRGFGEQSQTRVLVLVDGVRYNPADMSAINWSSIPLGAVENIEVLRGAQSAMYGGHAEAGVVKISTIRPTEGYDVYASGLYGSYGLYDISALASGREGDAYFSVNASTYSYDGYRDFSDAWSNYASMMFGYDLSDSTSITFKGDYGESKVSYAAGVDWDTFQNNPRYAPNFSTLFRDKTGLYTADLKSESDSAKFDALFGLRFRDRTWYDNGRELPKYNNQWTYTFSPKIEITAIEDTKIFAGVDANYSNIDLTQLSRSRLTSTVYNDRTANVDRFDIGGYIGATHEFDKTWVFSGGGRVDAAYTGADWSTYSMRRVGRNERLTLTSQCDDSKWDAGFSGDLGVTYKLDKKSSLYARFDQIFHYPTTDEIAYYQTSATTPFNTDLNPEHGQNYEIGYKFKNGKWSAGVNGFATYLHNEIMWDETRQLNVNLDPTIRYGVDFGGSYDDECWGASLFGTFVKAKFDGGRWDGKDVPLVAPFNTTAQVYVKPLEFVTCLARFTYFTESVAGNDFENDLRKIPWYYTVDFQVNVAFTRYFTIFGAIENATDENYAAFAYKSGTDLSFYPNAGRTFKIGINIKL